METDRFKSKELNTDQQLKAALVRHSFKTIYDHLDDKLPEGREKSLYITKLDEACMWAIKAISMENKDENF